MSTRDRHDRLDLKLTQFPSERYFLHVTTDSPSSEEVPCFS